MPSKTPKQKRFMAAVAHNAEFASEVGVPQTVGREFFNADQRRARRQSVERAFKRGKHERRSNRPERAA